MTACVHKLSIYVPHRITKTINQSLLKLKKRINVGLSITFFCCSWWCCSLKNVLLFLKILDGIACVQSCQELWDYLLRLLPLRDDLVFVSVVLALGLRHSNTYSITPVTLTVNDKLPWPVTAISICISSRTVMTWQRKIRGFVFIFNSPLRK